MYFSFLFFLFFFLLFRATPVAYGISWARGQIKVATFSLATHDPSCFCNLCHSSQQCQILNPLSEARDWTHILTDTSWVCNQLSHDRNPEIYFLIRLESWNGFLLYGLQSECCVSGLRKTLISYISFRAFGWPGALCISSNILKGIFFFLSSESKQWA